jgi:DNA-binding beta-propeller fold protein YncE
MLPPREGVATQSISDFEFDGYGRLICALPAANSIAITNPVNPPEMIVVQRIIGGANDGTSHQPGDFYGPMGVAVDPRNQQIFITDTGLNRVQVFDNQGNFIRMFGTGIASAGLNLTSPNAIEVDSFGNVYIAVDNADGTRLVILNEFGEPISYGSIDGFVRDKKTGVTLDNVIVTISSTYREYLTVTDGNGYFRFDTVPQGDHTLIAQRDGYNAGYGQVFVTGGYKSGVTIYMDRVGTGQSGYGDITGKLMSSIDGDQLSGLIVTVEGLGITDTSNYEGTFHLVNVPAGKHVLQILSNSVILYEQDVVVNSDAVTPLGFIYLPL